MYAILAGNELLCDVAGCHNIAVYVAATNQNEGCVVQLCPHHVALTLAEFIDDPQGAYDRLSRKQLVIPGQ